MRAFYVTITPKCGNITAMIPRGKKTMALPGRDGAAGEAEELRREVESLQDRLAKLSRVSLRITQDLDLDAVLEEVLDGARLLTNARHGGLVTYDGSGAVDRFITSGVPEEDQYHVEAWFRNPSSLYYLHQISRPMRLTDFPKYITPAGFPNTSMAEEAFMGMPIRLLDVQVGAIFLRNREDGREFTSEDEETLVWFASHAAFAINNAFRYIEERQAKSSLQALVDNSPVGVLVFDPKTMSYTQLNEETRRIVGGMRGAGRSLEGLLEQLTVKRPDGSDYPLRDLPPVRALATGETVRAEEIIVQVPGRPPVTTVCGAVPTFSESGDITSVVCTLQDMTPMEELLKQRSQFVGMVGHELRTPLTTIKGAATTALDSSPTADTNELLQFFRIIDEQAGHMRRLISDLLDLTRIDAGTLSITPDPNDVAQLFEGARNAFLRDGARNIVEIDLPPKLPRVNVDRQRILQVLGNLLSNASRHSPDWSSIRLSAVEDDVYVAFTVSDKGSGISAQYLPYLFEKVFPQELNNRMRYEQGNGLGLAICKGIVEAHGGRIRAESSGEGLGAEFTFTVPSVAEAISIADGPAASSSTAAREGVRILAVDDEAQVLRYIRNTLLRAGYTTFVTSNPDEAERLVEAENPHLILMDLMLPGADGIELTKRILGITDVPVIFVSGYGDDPSIERAFTAGADDYIVKPFSSSELVARIEAVLRRQVPSGRARTHSPYRLGDLGIEYSEHRVTVAGRQSQLTATEYNLLYELSTNAGRVLSHDELLRRVWGPNYAGDSRLLRAMVKKLRRKLGDDATNPKYIVTEPRVGYRMYRPESSHP